MRTETELRMKSALTISPLSLGDATVERDGQTGFTVATTDKDFFEYDKMYSFRARPLSSDILSWRSVKEVVLYSVFLKTFAV